jgi:hypothetical protein
VLSGGPWPYGAKTCSAGVKFIKSILRQLGFDSAAEWRAKHLKDGIRGIGGVRPVMQINFVEFRPSRSAADEDFESLKLVMPVR